MLIASCINIGPKREEEEGEEEEEEEKEKRNNEHEHLLLYANRREEEEKRPRRRDAHRFLLIKQAVTSDTSLQARSYIITIGLLLSRFEESNSNDERQRSATARLSQFVLHSKCSRRRRYGKSNEHAMNRKFERRSLSLSLPIRKRTLKSYRKQSHSTRHCRRWVH